MSRFCSESLRPESIQPWVVSDNLLGCFGLIFIQSYTLYNKFMLYEASLLCSQSCKNILVYYRVKHLHLYAILKSDPQITLETIVISMASWFIKQISTFDLIIFLTFPHLKLNNVLN